MMTAFLKKGLFAALVVGLMAGYAPSAAWAGSHSETKKADTVKKDTADSDAKAHDDMGDDEAAPDAAVED